MATRASKEWARRHQGWAWRNPDFRRLWTATTISVFGSKIGELAIPLLAIITLAAEPSEVGLLRTAQFLPFLVATLPLGLLVDRSPRRRLMILADAGRFILVGLIPVLVWVGVRQIEILYALVFAAGGLTVLYQLADFAYLPSIVTSDEITDANAKLAAAKSANEVAGKGVGGVVVEILSAPIAVLFDAFTFVLSAISLSRITSSEELTRAETHPRSVLREASHGLVFAVRHHMLRPLLGEGTTVNLFNEMFVLGMLVYAVRDLELSAALIGVVFVAGGVGNFLGAWFGPRLAGRFGYGKVLLTAVLLGDTAPVAVILLDSNTQIDVPLLMIVFFVAGTGAGMRNVQSVSLRQTVVPVELRGRVQAGYRLILWGAIPAGAALGGSLASITGARTAMLTGALGMALGTLWIALSSIPRLESIADAT